MTDTIPALGVRDLCAGYGGAPIIDGLDLDIARGRFTVLLGPNGCGKSTLLKTCAGLLPPARGAVLLNGGRKIAEGPAEAVLTPALIAETFDVDVQVLPDPESGRPFVLVRAG